MTAISVICAPPNGRNPGMATVDLAFAEIAQAAGVDDVTYWRLWDQSEWVADPSGSYSSGYDAWHDPDTELDYRNLRGHLDAAVAADVVVFWGDFLHMAPYHAEAARILDQEIGCAANRSEARQIVADHLFLDAQGSGVLERTASFGTTLSLNRPTDYTGLYGERLRRFLSRAGAVAMRDGYSAQVVRDARADWRGSYMTPDLALLRDAGLPSPDRDGLGVFFARSQLAPEPLAQIGNALAKATGLRPAWIDWGREPAFWPMQTRKRFRLAWPALEQCQRSLTFAQRIQAYRALAEGRGPERAAHQPPLDELLDQVKSFRAVITDTYHLAVNAWRSGVPALCVLDAPGAKWSVNSGAPDSARDKRWDLYSSLDALAFTTVGSRSISRMHAEAGRLAALVEDERAVEQVVERIERRAELGKATIAASIRGLAGSQR